jgi:hypothetical protein
MTVTSRVSVYDVLNARTSEKNGARPWMDAAAGRVMVVAAIAGDADSKAARIQGAPGRRIRVDAIVAERRRVFGAASATD